MNTTWSIYDKATGLFSGRIISCNNEERLQQNILDTEAAVEGEIDHLSKRVDLVTGEVVDYQPPQPSPDHEWNATTKRWQLTAAAQAVIDADNAARAQLEEIDRQSIRALREAAIGNADAVVLLQNLEAQAVPLRADVIVETPVDVVTP